jgi:hypothetical protein
MYKNKKFCYFSKFIPIKARAGKGHQLVAVTVIQFRKAAVKEICAQPNYTWNTSAVL